MGVERYVLDTSALLTFMEDEPGADRVANVLGGSHVIIPWVVLLEAHYIVRQERGGAEADRRYALMRELPATVVWEMDERSVLLAARFKADHRVSLADAIVAALATRHAAVLLHKDPEFEALSDEVRLEALPYKRC